MKRLLTILSLAILMLGGNLASARPPEAPFSQIWVFGGPLEDTGNFASVIGDLPPPFYQNRFCDGPLAVEILAEQLGLTLKPSLHRVGPVQGNNFSSVDGLASGAGPQDLHGQIDAYFGTTGNRADANALYYVIIGGNEVVGAARERDNAKAFALVNAAVRAKERAIYRLVAAGATTLLVPNFIDISITPQIRALGLAARGHQMSLLHNRLMEQMLDRVERRLDFLLIRDDFREFADETLQAAGFLRFTNITDSCLEKLPLGECDFSRFVFFNDLFPTHRAHQLWGWRLVGEVVKSVANRYDRGGGRGGAAAPTVPADKAQ